MASPVDFGETGDILVDPMIVLTFAQPFRVMVGSNDFLGLLGN